MSSHDAYLQAPSNKMFPQVFPWTLPQDHSAHQAFNSIQDPFVYSSPQSTNYSTATFFNNNNRSSSSSSEHLRLISDAVLGHVSGGPFGLQADQLGKLSAQEIMDAKALAASKSHSEAERRRRERINNHLAKLRSLLPSTTKTDKASLLAEVIQHVKELKRQTSLIHESNPIPTEMDELIIDNEGDEEGRLVIKASICCEDRSDLLPDLIKTLKALRLRTLKAEITTLGGRVKNVLFITDDRDLSASYEQETSHHEFSISSIEEALKAVMEKTDGDASSTGSAHVKRQRTNSISVMSSS
nr:bHLH7 [Bupleurum chinense]